MSIVTNEASDDSQLLEEYARTRSPQAFASIVGKYVDFVYSAALRRVRDAHLAEDVAQAVFVILAQRAHRLKPGTVLPGWLYRATRYAASNALRLQRRRKSHEQAAGQLPRTERRMDPKWQQIEPVLDAAMDSLRRGDRELILLRYFQGQSLSDMGRGLGASENTTSKRLSRALERLRRALEQRGITAAETTLGVLLSQQAVQDAPAALKSAAGAMGSNTAAATGKAAAIAKGATLMMSISVPMKISAVAAVSILVPTAIVVTALQQQQAGAPPATAPATPAAAAEPAAPAAPAQWPAALDRVIPEVRFADVGFADTIDFLRDVSQVNFFVDWQALSAVGIDRNAPIALRLRNTRLGDAITAILQAAAKPDTVTGFSIGEEDVVIISTVEAGQELLLRRATVQRLKRTLPASARQLPEIKLDGVPLQDVANFLTDISGVKVAADWENLAQAGIKPDTKVSARYRNLSVATSLDLVLASLSNDQFRISAVVENNGIVIRATKREIPPGQL
jgi:RNA polymerase sigma factor (sigma-70 family)